MAQGIRREKVVLDVIGWAFIMVLLNISLLCFITLMQTDIEDYTDLGAYVWTVASIDIDGKVDKDYYSSGAEDLSENVFTEQKDDFVFDKQDSLLNILGALEMAGKLILAGIAGGVVVAAYLVGNLAQIGVFGSLVILLLIMISMRPILKFFLSKRTEE